MQPRLNSSNSLKKLTPRARVTKKLLMELGLVDVWRVLHPTDKQFTIYFASQVAYSRIDYCFVHNSDRHRLTDCKMEPEISLIIHLST